MLQLPPFDPTEPVPVWEFLIPLSGVEYLVTFTYRSRQNRWYVTIADAEGTPIYNGVALRLNSGINWAWKYKEGWFNGTGAIGDRDGFGTPDAPNGRLIYLMDLADKGVCSFEDFGHDCIPVFQSFTEFIQDFFGALLEINPDAAENLFDGPRPRNVEVLP